MITEIARSIKILKKGDISIDSYEKNTFPKEYKKHKIDNKDGKALERLLQRFDDHTLEPLDSADNYKWWGILRTLNDLGLKDNKRLERFKELVAEDCTTKDYIVELNMMFANQGLVYGKIQHNKLVFTRDVNNATPMPKYTAKYKAQSYPSAKIKKIDTLN